MSDTDKGAQETLNTASDKKTEPSTDTDNRPSHRPAETEISNGGMIFYGYLVLLFIVYGFLSFILPGLLSLLWDNPVGTMGLLTFGFLVFILLTKFITSLSRSSFVEIDRKARGESTLAAKTMSPSLLSEIIKAFYVTAPKPDVKVIDEAVLRSSKQQKIDEDKLFERERPLGTPFELYIFGVVEGLDKHISLTEEKGSNLLDRGLLFLFGGIVFYIVVIAAWQVWAKYGEPKDNIMYIGMFASSVVFLVCEFLAAWFLKQYRHYVDASLACLKVKSVYDRYLLSYYAIKESGSEAGGVSEKLNRMLETIKEDVMWPGHKENLSNDFNYMLESMTSVHASLDKFKGLFEASAKSGKSKP